MLAAKKTAKFGPDFGQVRHLIANISGTKQDIVNGKRRYKLQSLLRMRT